MFYGFSYVMTDGTMLCQLMCCSSEQAIKIIREYARHCPQISPEDLQSCVELINGTSEVDPLKQVTFTGKTLSICIQSDQ